MSRNREKRTLSRERNEARFNKRNQLRLDVPSPDSVEAREITSSHHKKFGKEVIWVSDVSVSTATPVTDIVNGSKITANVVNDIKTKAEPKVDVVDTIKNIDTVKVVKKEIIKKKLPAVPKTLICPHCGSKAQTKQSFLKNHGDSCMQKE